MGRTSLRKRIKGKVFLLDGAMVTELIAYGVEAGKCNDYLNIESADIIFNIHQAYLMAGSDAVLTNTFGANRYALARHGFGEMAEKINVAGGQIARRAAGEERYVLGDIGPSGDFLEPLGSLKAADLKDAFSEQAKSLLEGGVDGFIIETMTALDEAMIAVEAVKSVCELPVFVSLAFDSAGGDFRTMMGVDVEGAVSKIISMGVDAIGFNCGRVPLGDCAKLAAKFVSAIKALEQDIIVLAEPNAGLPELIGNKAVYSVLPEDFAAAAEKICLAGVNIIGGCCGTGPAHIEAIARKLKKR